MSLKVHPKCKSLMNLFVHPKNLVALRGRGSQSPVVGFFWFGLFLIGKSKRTLCFGYPDSILPN